MIEGGKLETARLHVRPFDPADSSRLIEIFSDPAVARFVGDGTPLEADDAKLWIANSRRNLVQFGYGTGAVIENASRRMIGWAGFARPDDGSEEIIYGFEKSAWGKGFGSELVSALVAFGIRRGIPILRATVDQQNQTSVALLEKHGFRLCARDYRDEKGCMLYERRNAGKIAQI